MAVGGKSRDVHAERDRATAFNAVARAADAIGKILEQSEAMGTLTVRPRKHAPPQALPAPGSQ